MTIKQRLEKLEKALGTKEKRYVVVMDGKMENESGEWVPFVAREPNTVYIEVVIEESRSRKEDIPASPEIAPPERAAEEIPSDSKPIEPEAEKQPNVASEDVIPRSVRQWISECDRIFKGY